MQVVLRQVNPVDIAAARGRGHIIRIPATASTSRANVRDQIPAGPRQRGGRQDRRGGNNAHRRQHAQGPAPPAAHRPQAPRPAQPPPLVDIRTPPNNQRNQPPVQHPVPPVAQEVEVVDERLINCPVM